MINFLMKFIREGYRMHHGATTEEEPTLKEMMEGVAKDINNAGELIKMQNLLLQGKLPDQEQKEDIPLCAICNEPSFITRVHYEGERMIKNNLCPKHEKTGENKQ